MTARSCRRIIVEVPKHGSADARTLDGGLMTAKFPTEAVRAEVPARLLDEMRQLVAAGWFGSLDEIMVDAMRRFVESHRAELMERFVHEDVAWGLRGEE